MLFLPSNAYTFISSSHDTVSWLDDVLSITSGHSLLNTCSTCMHVQLNCIPFDHLPLCFNISIDNLHVPIPPRDNPS